MKQCLFCSATKLSREHIFPDWIVEMFPKGDNYYTSTYTDTDGKQRICKTRSSIQETEYLVCKKPCNNEWMSRVETRAIPDLKPLIEDSRNAESLADVPAIAAWMTLRAMVFDGRNPQRYFHQDERETFRLSDGKTVPTNTHAWMAVYAGEPHRASCQPASNDHMLTVTCVLNRLAFKVVTFRPGAIDFVDSSLAAWERCARRIWPVAEGAQISWPPELPLVPEKFETFQKWLKPSNLVNPA